MRSATTRKKPGRNAPERFDQRRVEPRPIIRIGALRDGAPCLDPAGMKSM
jgi:hypothetical protein